ncbi:RDD family protein [Arcobacter arenosus]|uniref:RDD family protein n=1 Tax=Arcobacter arenosus TaxID=2576037 RepID=UPI003BAA004C
MNNTDNLELATIRSRTLAFVIDDFLITFIVIAMYWNSISSTGDDLATLLLIMNEFVWQVLFLKFIYQTFFVWYYGATIGKIVAKIKVIDYNHFGRVSIFTAMTRSILRIISEMFFYIGFIFAFFNDGRQTFHDKIGRTLVVNA